MPNILEADLDLLILPGGADLSPTNKGFRGNGLSYMTGMIDPHYEYFRTYLLQEYINQNIPMFGICLGFQLLASQFNSKLIAHITDHDDGMHQIQTVSTRPLTIKVNTFHHQGVTSLGKDLIPKAYAIKKHGEVYIKDICEAFVHKDFPIAGVQWHPERMENLLSSSTYKQTNCVLGDLVTHDLITSLLTHHERV